MRSDRLLACARAATGAMLMSACADGRDAPDAGGSGAVSLGIFPAPNQAFVLEYPVEGVDLDQGWHREGVRKAVATCIDFAAGGNAASVINTAVIDRHVREVSRRRCERDLEDPGCLLESQIEELRRQL
jgi:hypothetical protein